MEHKYEKDPAALEVVENKSWRRPRCFAVEELEQMALFTEVQLWSWGFKEGGQEQKGVEFVVLEGMNGTMRRRLVGERILWRF